MSAKYISLLPISWEPLKIVWFELNLAGYYIIQTWLFNMNVQPYCNLTFFIKVFTTCKQILYLNTSMSAKYISLLPISREPLKIVLYVKLYCHECPLGTKDSSIHKNILATIYALIYRPDETRQTDTKRGIPYCILHISNITLHFDIALIALWYCTHIIIVQSISTVTLVGTYINLETLNNLCNSRWQSVIFSDFSTDIAIFCSEFENCDLWHYISKFLFSIKR